MKRKAHPHEHEAEINLVPYLDIMVNLVMFMLVSMASAAYAVVNVNMPDAGPDASAADPSTPPPEKKDEQFTMTVSLSRTGIILSSTEAVLPTMACLTSHPEGKKVADADGCLPDGYDYDKLASSLRSIKSRHQKTSAMFLAADATVQYDALIRVMDVSRNARCSDIGEMSAKCDDGKDRTCGIPGGTCRKDGNAFYCECPLFPDVAFAAIQ